MLSQEMLNRIRLAEIQKINSYLPAKARILEMGAGSGYQALELARR